MGDFEKFVQGFAYKKSSGVGVADMVVNHVAPTGKSEGERLVHKILKDLGYKYYTDYLVEYTFEELGRLRFDFFIRSPALLIEFDGNQHYEGSRFHKTREDWIQSIERDELKNRFCRDKGISLLRIPQIYVKTPKKLKVLIFEFIRKVGEGPTPLIEVDLYFQWKSGKIII
jgi:very-short-patch-repair endonuclease